MNKKLYGTAILGVFVIASVLMLAFNTGTVLAQDEVIPDWVGSETCADCHSTIYEQQQRHGHSYKLNRVVDGQPPEYPYSEVLDTPEGYTWDDISFVIGGFSWKARFIDHDGYIITGDEDATTQYNFPLIDSRTGEVIKEAGWVGYHAGEENKPYDCGSCHTTAYNHDAETNMYDMPGMIGQWTEEGVQCEECHGPGSLHVQEPIRAQMPIERSTEACGNCHYRGSEGVVESSGGFIKHHEQYEEIATAPHAAMECIDCHNPHQSAVYADEEFNPNRGQRVTCTSCHFVQTRSPEHVENNVTCVDCHMPPMTASGARDADLLWGDVSTHLYQINTDTDAPQFTEDGSGVMPYITLEYACTRCHSDWGTNRMARGAVGYHDTE
jgi:hypothetical protein